MEDIKESIKYYNKLLIEFYENIDDEANVESMDSFILIEILMNLRKLNDNIISLVNKEPVIIQQQSKMKQEEKNDFENYEE